MKWGYLYGLWWLDDDANVFISNPQEGEYFVRAPHQRHGPYPDLETAKVAAEMLYG